MIKAELIHNPYLLETEVLFNGRTPRINSLVEKYKEGTLQSWIKKVPSIFYDEMNGYHFDLEFTGTKLDFEELKTAFADAGVSEELVHLFHKNELDDRAVKLRKIEQLLFWLKEHQDRQFDNDAFRKTNRELFESKFSFLVFQQHPFDASGLNGSDVEAEYVSEYKEVETTNLSNTPILIFISQENQRDFQYIVSKLLERSDVIKDQIFFMTHSAVDCEQVKRVVMDLGIENPLFISDLTDPVIQKYLDFYPRTEHISEAIKAFRIETNEIGTKLESQNRESAIVNKSIYAKIEELEIILGNLKESLNKFNGRDNIDVPVPWLEAQQSLITAIINWRNKRTRIAGTEEATKIAYEFDADLKGMYQNYLEKVNFLAFSKRESIRNLYCSWYTAADYDSAFADSSDDIFMKEPNTGTIPLIVEKLLALKEEYYVRQKEDLIGKLFKPSLQEQKEPVFETIYYYQNWRDYVAGVMEPLAGEVLQNYYEVLKDYEKQVADLFIRHLEYLIREKTDEKELVSSNLSEDEKKLQYDNDWLADFYEKLKDIERG